MEFMYLFIFLGVSAYLVGAIPFGYLVGKWHGLDIRTLGSGNIGSTNVTRIMGKTWGRMVFILDFLKGFLPTLILHYFILSYHTLALQTPEITNLTPWLLIFFLLPILGHLFPIFLKWKGGKGVATTAGVLLALSPVTFISTLSVFIILFYKFRIISLASLSSAILLPFFFFISSQPILRNALTSLTPLNLANRSLVDQYPNTFLLGWIAMSLWIVIRHRSNIKRLLSGTEQAFKK